MKNVKRKIYVFLLDKTSTGRSSVWIPNSAQKGVDASNFFQYSSVRTAASQTNSVNKHPYTLSSSKYSSFGTPVLHPSTADNGVKKSDVLKFSSMTPMRTPVFQANTADKGTKMSNFFKYSSVGTPVTHASTADNGAKTSKVLNYLSVGTPAYQANTADKGAKTSDVFKFSSVRTPVLQTNTADKSSKASNFFKYSSVETPVHDTKWYIGTDFFPTEDVTRSTVPATHGEGKWIKTKIKYRQEVHPESARNRVEQLHLIDGGSIPLSKVSPKFFTDNGKRKSFVKAWKEKVKDISVYNPNPRSILPKKKLVPSFRNATSLTSPWKSFMELWKERVKDISVYNPAPNMFIPEKHFNPLFRDTVTPHGASTSFIEARKGKVKDISVYNSVPSIFIPEKQRTIFPERRWLNQFSRTTKMNNQKQTPYFLMQNKRQPNIGQRSDYTESYASTVPASTQTYYESTYMSPMWQSQRPGK